MVKLGQNRPRHYSDALVEVNVLHNAIMLDNLRTLEDNVKHLSKEGRRNGDISDPTSLQLADERI